MENSSVAHAVEWLMTGRIDTPAAIHEEMNETSFQASLFFNKHFIDLLYVADVGCCRYRDGTL